MQYRILYCRRNAKGAREMIKFLIVFCSMAAMFFAFGQGMDEGKNSDCHIGFKGVIFFGLLELLLMFLL